MASTEREVQKPADVSAEQPENVATDKLTDALAKVEIEDQDSSSVVNEEKESQQPPRPLHIYTRVDALTLSKSPLVTLPDGMPSLKDWFGDWNEQQVSNKKEAENSGSSTTARERRFRRDAEDGDAPARPSFRTSLSQPSQMGNFRHQSLRTTERDRDADRERQRDERDREGQERLRNLSDRYDRERLALTSGGTGTLRNKDRESAPHLSSGSSARKKPGEASDDWRRGADPSRANRDDRSDTRRDRDRPRDSSRPRREPSSTRRDRDRDDRDRPRRGEDREDRRDKDDYGRRDRDDYFRRDWDDRDRDDSYRDRDRYDHGRHSKDIDRETDDDPRRWRDDGRREERMASRRDRDREGARGWDRWEPSHDRDRERVDDRDGRSKRVSGRDRRSGGGLDEPRDREDKREREKEKEPAWMETYVPTTPGGGILGGQTEGQLDGIQAWKKGMKEKEKKNKEGEPTPEVAKKKDDNSEPTPQASTSSAPTEPAMDEIQLFKLMMKAAKKDTDQSDASAPASAVQSSENGSTVVAKEGLTETVSPTPVPASTSASRNELPAHPLKSFTPSSGSAPAAPTIPASSENGARLLSLISSNAADVTPSSASVIAKPSTPNALDQAGPRLFANPPGLPSNIFPDRSTVDLSSPASANPGPFNPPVGSRLLAFGSRANAPNTNPANAAPKAFPPPDSAVPLGSAMAPGMSMPNAHKFGGMTPPPPGMGLNMGMQGSDVDSQFGTNPRATPSERSIRSFSPFGQPQPPMQGGYTVDEIQDAMRVAQLAELRRQPGMSPVERAGLGLGGDGASQYIDLGRASPGFSANVGPFEAGGANAMAKGSRFAKFFDAKHRDVQAGPGMRKGPAGPGLVPTPPLPGQRADNLPIGAMGGVNLGGERTVDDLFAMLQSSSQGHRVTPQVAQGGRMSAGVPFGQSPVDLHALQQQQQFLQNARQDALYESRLDDRNFVPDGMVPGLRPAARPRSREPSAVLFPEQAEELLHMNMQRHPQQQRNLEQMYAGPGVQALYNQQAGMVRNGNAALQQAQFRNSPTALGSQQNVLPGPSQRLPPGLANLGGRPPHDPSQFINSHVGGLHGGIHPNAPAAQQGFNNFGGGGPGFNNTPGLRGPLPGAHHQNPLAVNQLGGLAGGISADLRGPNQLLGMNAGGLGGGLRGGVGAGFNPQHAPAAQLQQAQQLAFRQQQQQQQQRQHVPAHMVSHIIPPHLQQQQQAIHSGNSQGTQDLMALLMGGHRD